MRNIPFVKYTAYGNNFLVVDEIRGRMVPETEKSYAATQATNRYFGVGADGVLFIQPARKQVLKEIEEAFGYNIIPAETEDADFIFRLFEPNGIESLSCGNGLLSLAGYLHQYHNIPWARMVTGIPGGDPKVVSIGTDRDAGIRWADLGAPSPMPSVLADPVGLSWVSAPLNRPGLRSGLKSSMDLPGSESAPLCSIELKIRFRRNTGVRFFEKSTTLTLQGYLVFNGEPHLVIFVEEGISRKEVAETMFVSESDADRPERMANAGTWLIDFIGNDIQKQYDKVFPHGINIDFARVVDRSGVVEYRCFERGIDAETLACGTGAAAVAHAARSLGRIDGDAVTVLPHRSRWYHPDAALRVENHGNGWTLYGRPDFLCEGEFLLNDRYTIPAEEGNYRAQRPLISEPVLVSN